MSLIYVMSCLLVLITLLISVCIFPTECQDFHVFTDCRSLPVTYTFSDPSIFKLVEDNSKQCYLYVLEFHSLQEKWQKQYIKNSTYDMYWNVRCQVATCLKGFLNQPQKKLIEIVRKLCFLPQPPPPPPPLAGFIKTARSDEHFIYP